MTGRHRAPTQLPPAARVLHVCAANQCRSVIAEAAMRRLLTERGVVTRAPDGAAVPDGAVIVGGAGLRTSGGQPVWPPVTQWLAQQGLSSFGPAGPSRRLLPSMPAEADLVLVATRALRDELVAMAAPAQAAAVQRRTFTWRELAWLLREVDPSQLVGDTAANRFRELPTVAAARRGLAAAPSGDELDVADPVERAVELDVAAAAILAAVRVVVDVAVPLSS